MLNTTLKGRKFRHQGQQKLVTTKLTAVASEVSNVSVQLLKGCK